MRPRRTPDDDPNLAELGLILGFIGLALIVALVLFGGQVSAVLDTSSGGV
jgi:Flp pilus assembly pilin Flp